MDAKTGNARYKKWFNVSKRILTIQEDRILDQNNDELEKKMLHIKDIKIKSYHANYN